MFVSFIFNSTIVLGIILTHDLTNRKSQENLKTWLSEILNREERALISSPGSSKYTSISIDDNMDPEKFLGSTQVLFDSK